MTEQQVIAYLNRAYRAKELIDSMQEELTRLQALLDKTESRYQSSHKRGSFLARIIEKEQLQKKRIAQYVESLEQVHQVLEAVQDPDQRLLLQLRYINFKTWEEVAEVMHYSTVWIFRLHKRALGAAAEVIHAREQQLAAL